MYDQIAIIPVANQILVNGKVHRFKFDCLAIHQKNTGLHAIQWKDGKGWIEWQNLTAEQIEGEEAYKEHCQYYAELWDAKEEAEKKAEAERQAEADRIFNSPEQRAERIRANREHLISDTDYLMLADVWVTLSETQQKEITTYRQALRDITSLEGFPWADNEVPWPTKPSIVK